MDHQIENSIELNTVDLTAVVGNPFRPATLDPAHRTATVVSLAQAAYDERQLPSGELDPHRLTVLADALEEVGAPGEMVAHLRGWSQAYFAARAALRACSRAEMLLDSADSSSRAASWDRNQGSLAVERAAIAELARCVVGNPFRPATLDPAHRTATVVSLAQAAYDERQLPSGELDPHRLTVLADALEEVGAPGEMVAHLRSPSPHVRGCFALDLALGLS